MIDASQVTVDRRRTAGQGCARASGGFARAVYDAMADCHHSDAVLPCEIDEFVLVDQDRLSGLHGKNLCAGLCKVSKSLTLFSDPVGGGC